MDDAPVEAGGLPLLEPLEAAEPAPAGFLSADLVSAFLSEPDFSGPDFSRPDFSGPDLSEPQSPSAPLLDPLRLSVR